MHAADDIPSKNAATRDSIVCAVSCFGHVVLVFLLYGFLVV